MANKNMRNLMMVTMEYIMFEACANDLMPPYLHPSALPVGFLYPSHFYNMKCTIKNFVQSVSTNRADS